MLPNYLIQSMKTHQHATKKASSVLNNSKGRVVLTERAYRLSKLKMKLHSELPATLSLFKLIFKSAFHQGLSVSIAIPLLLICFALHI